MPESLAIAEARSPAAGICGCWKRDGGIFGAAGSRRAGSSGLARAFYFYRRNLEDLAGWVGSIADDRMEAMGPAATIRVVADLLAEMPLIEEKIRRVRALLAGRDRTRTEP